MTKKLWLKDNKLLIKDNKLMLSEECCCNKFPCTFSHSETAEISTASADYIGDIYRCSDWWTDPETGESYCMNSVYDHCHLPGYARWGDCGTPEFPAHTFYGLKEFPDCDKPKTGTLSCTVSGAITAHYDQNYGTYYNFDLQISASVSVASMNTETENVWGSRGTIALVLPRIPSGTPPGGYGSPYSMTAWACGDDHGKTWVNGTLRALAWHGWFVPSYCSGDAGCFDPCEAAWNEVYSDRPDPTEADIIPLLSGFRLSAGAWNGACCGACSGGGVDLYVRQYALTEDAARAACAAWSKSGAIQIGLSDG